MTQVLIADDHPPTVNACRLALAGIGGRVLAAASVEEAARLCADSAPDLVVLDAALPGDVLSFCRNARSERTRATRRLLLLVPPRFRPDDLAALRPLADECLAKPFTVARFAERVRALLAEQAERALVGRPAESSRSQSGLAEAAPRSASFNMEIGGCRLECELGRGATSTVYLGRHLLLDVQVAVKLLPASGPETDDDTQRFIRGARAAAGIQHPNVVSILNAGWEQGYYYLVQRYIEGETLKARMEREGPQDEPFLRRVLRDIASGLAAAHRLGVVHRDVKPANIILAASGAAMLTDFGLARALGTGDISASSDVIGTPWYLSPEQCAGRAVDPRSDLYALGATAYHAATGQPPFPGDSPVAVLRGHLDLAPRSPRDLRPTLSREFCDLILRLLAKSPESRPFSAEAVVEELERG